MDEQYPVVLADMPTTIRSYVCKHGDDIVIVINARLAAEDRLQRYKHEVDHITAGDIMMSSGADMIEIHAHHI